MIIREHVPISNLFVCLWFNEVDRFTSRDQISFSTVRDKLWAKTNWTVNMFLDCERRNFVVQVISFKLKYKIFLHPLIFFIYILYVFFLDHFVLLLWLQCRNTIEITSFQIRRPFLLILSPHPSLLLLKLHHHQPWLVTCRRNFHWKLLVKELYVFLPGRSHQGVGAGGLHRGVIAKPLAVTGTLIQVKKSFVQRKEKKGKKERKKNLHSFSYPFENSSRGWDICGR